MRFHERTAGFFKLCLPPSDVQRTLVFNPAPVSVAVFSFPGPFLPACGNWLVKVVCLIVALVPMLIMGCSEYATHWRSFLLSNDNVGLPLQLSLTPHHARQTLGYVHNKGIGNVCVLTLININEHSVCNVGMYITA